MAINNYFVNVIEICSKMFWHGEGYFLCMPALILCHAAYPTHVPYFLLFDCKDVTTSIHF